MRVRLNEFKENAVDNKEKRRKKLSRLLGKEETEGREDGNQRKDGEKLPCKERQETPQQSMK